MTDDQDRYMDTVGRTFGPPQDPERFKEWFTTSPSRSEFYSVILGIYDLSLDILSAVIEPEPDARLKAQRQAVKNAGEFRDFLRPLMKALEEAQREDEDG